MSESSYVEKPAFLELKEFEENQNIGEYKRKLRENLRQSHFKVIYTTVQKFQHALSFC